MGAKEALPGRRQETFPARRGHDVGEEERRQDDAKHGLQSLQRNGQGAPKRGQSVETGVADGVDGGEERKEDGGNGEGPGKGQRQCRRVDVLVAGTRTSVRTWR